MTRSIGFRWLRPLLLLLLAPAALACGELSRLEAGVCGNAIREEGEDCDTYAEPGKSCRPPTAKDNTGCHYDCSLGSDHECPQEARCGLDGVCHYASNEHEKWGAFLPMPAESLQLGDFDGDGRQDLLALGDVNWRWQGYPRILFFDEAGLTHDIIDPRFPISSPIAMALEPSKEQTRQSQQLVFCSAYGIGAAEVTGDRIALPIPYPIQVLPPGWSYRVLRVGQVRQAPLNEIVMLFMSGDGDAEGPGTISDTAGGTSLGTLEKPVNEFAGTPIAANFVDSNSPCEEAVLAYLGDPSVYLFEPCDANGNLVVSDKKPHSVAKLPDAHTVGQTPIPTRVNTEDDKLDLLIADSSSKPYVAFGRGDGTFAADPNNFDATIHEAWPISVVPGDSCSGQELPTAFPLAAADLNDDGRTDWVTRYGVQLTQSVTIDPVHRMVKVAACIFEAPYGRLWSVAKIADINGDTLPDVIAGSDSASDLDLWRGTRLSGLNPSAILTRGPVQHLNTGDFDGDGINDIVFDALKTSHDADTPGAATLSIAFGRVALPPEAPIAIGNFASIGQIETALYDGFDTMDEIGVIATPDDSLGQQLSVFIGTAGRRPIAPMGLEAPGPAPGELIQGVPLALAAGKLFGSAQQSLLVASIFCASLCENRLWLVSNGPGGRFGIPVPSALLPDAFVTYRMSEGELSVQLLVGDVDGGGNDDAFALTTDTAGTGIMLWRVALPAEKHFWTEDPPVELLSTTPGKLTAASQPKLVDLDGDGRRDLVMIVRNGQGIQQLGVVRNLSGSLDISRIRYIETPQSSTVNAFATVEDRGNLRLYAITDGATFDVRVGNDGSATLEPIPGVPGGVSIAVGNVAGSGLRDLAIGDSDGVQIYREVPTRRK